MPGFGLLMYNAPAAGVNTVNLDFTAATDTDFTPRNGHYTFAERYRLLGACTIGASVTRGRFQVPTWNAIGEMILFNANRSLQPPSNAQWDWFGQFGPEIPQDEEFQVQVSNNLGAATEIENVALLIGAMDWSRNITPGQLLIPVRASFTVTPTLNAWSFGNTITLSASLRGGSYAVMGAVCQGSNAAAFRLNFPAYQLYGGRRKLRPGWITQNALGDVVQTQIDPWVLGMGEWGRFQTFELPTVDIFGTAAAGTTYQLFMWLQYLGRSRDLVNQPIGSPGVGASSLAALAS